MIHEANVEAADSAAGTSSHTVAHQCGLEPGWRSFATGTCGQAQSGLSRKHPRRFAALLSAGGLGSLGGPERSGAVL